MKLAIVSATLDYPRMQDCFKSWIEHATQHLSIYLVAQGAGDRDWERIALVAGTSFYGYHCREIVGVVPAFAIGVKRALYDGADVVACFHDDLEIDEDGWDEQIVRLFRTCPLAGLCGFGGATGLGDDDMYQTPFQPMQLARKRFGSNMRDAEVHGERWEAAQPVACLDGFSQVGLASFWRGGYRVTPTLNDFQRMDELIDNVPSVTLFDQMTKWGVVHHFYDGMLGCFAKRLGYQTWYLPVRCHHYGGRTAVGDPRYQEWAQTHAPLVKDQKGDLAAGDAAFWLRAHQIGYEQFRDVLPLRT